MKLKEKCELKFSRVTNRGGEKSPWGPVGSIVAHANRQRDRRILSRSRSTRWRALVYHLAELNVAVTRTVIR